MAEWLLHWLEAEGSLADWRDRVSLEIHAAKSTISELVQPPRLDLLIEHRKGFVIPEIGIVGRAWRPSLLSLTLDPLNERFASSMENGALRRHVAHEVHHCMRMAGPGYGRTLGEALVSEGLAGHFVRRLFGNPPEAWECAVDQQCLVERFPEQAELASREYDHAAWFVGPAGGRPRWYGYSLGYWLVGRWLEKVGEIDNSMWINIPSQKVFSDLE